MVTTKMKPHMLVRADAGPAIGTGHVMRCLALAAAWKSRGGDVTFACQNLPGLMRNKITECEFEFYELTQNSIDDSQAREIYRLANQRESHWIVFDGYRYTDEFVNSIGRDRYKTLVIYDDPELEFPSASAVLNQNVYATERPGPTDSPKLLGTDFALLRPEMRPNDETKCRKKIQRILVTLGGSDANNVTQKVLEALEDKLPSHVTLDVVVGICNHNWQQLNDHVRKSRLEIRLHRNVDRMNTLIGRADMAVTAGGSTCYELAHFGVPFVVLPIAANQKPVAIGLHDQDAALSIDMQDSDWQSNLASSVFRMAKNHEQRRDMSERGKSLVDGKGAFRVCRFLCSRELSLTPTTMNDAQQLFEWRTDETVQEASFHRPPENLESHRIWLQEQVNRTDCRFFMVNHFRGGAIGQVRIECDFGRQMGTVSLSIDQDWRGLGYGCSVIELAKNAAADAGLHGLIAQIKPDNLSSIDAFKNAGFERTGQTIVNDQPAIEMAVSLNLSQKRAA